MIESPHPNDTGPRATQAAPALRQCNVLVLQGGGALGSYQAGAYDALCAHAYQPDWVAGISIGAINAAIIAGNPAEKRTAQLKAFWELATAPVPWRPLLSGDNSRSLFNESSAAVIATFGVPGFFTPRVPSPFLWPPGSIQSMSYYDTAPLRETLLNLVDFDLINQRKTRLSVGAVNIRNGNFVYFDNLKQTIGPEHIMASGALPPGFPPIEIDGEYYWDGGLVSNTPLDYVLEENKTDDLTIFQVDLFSARGHLPKTLLEAAEREKDIRYSSRTRMNTDKGRELRNMRKSIRELIARLPSEFQSDPMVQDLNHSVYDPTVAIVHLIYRDKDYEGNSKDYDFSRFGMLEHWAAGEDDVRRSLKHPLWLHRHQPKGSLITYDLAGQGVTK